MVWVSSSDELGVDVCDTVTVSDRAAIVAMEVVRIARVLGVSCLERGRVFLFFSWSMNGWFISVLITCKLHHVGFQ